MQISKQLKKEMNDAIDYALSQSDIDMTEEEKQSVEYATEIGISDIDRVGRVCDMLTTLGVQDYNRFDGFYSLINIEIPE